MSLDTRRTENHDLSPCCHDPKSLSLIHDIALILAEDAQIFAAHIECLEGTLPPADAIRLFAKKLRRIAMDFAPLGELGAFRPT